MLRKIARIAEIVEIAEIAERNGERRAERVERKYFGFPLHADDNDAGQEDDGDAADDAHVHQSVVDDLQILRLEQVVERFAEADDVHGHRHRVGHGEDDADRRSKVGTQRARDQKVRPS